MRPEAARLLLLNGSPAYRRLGAIVAGIALGVAMLLILLGAFLNLPERENRAAWASTDGTYAEWNDNDERISRPASDNAMLAAIDVDTFDGMAIHVLTVATTSSTTIEFPADLDPLVPGEFYASPAMVDLIHSTPPAQLSDRWGEFAGEIPASAVKGPSQHVVLVATQWDTLDSWSNAVVQSEFRATARSVETQSFRVILAMGAISLLVPITVFISIVSALGAAQRRERFATARLVGAGRKAVALMSGTEMAVAAFLGALLGAGLAALLRPAAAHLSIAGSTMTTQDLTPSGAWTVTVIVGVALLSGLTAFTRSYRDDVGALGATREREEKPVTAWRGSLLLFGLALFGGSTWGAVAMPEVAEMLSLTLIAGFAAIAFGIVLAGPWVTRMVSRLLGSRTASAATVVAARRLQRHPRSTFRSVAGLVVAVFAVSVFAGGSSAIALTTEARDLPGRLDMNAVLTWVESTAEVTVRKATELESTRFE